MRKRGKEERRGEIRNRMEEKRIGEEQLERRGEGRRGRKQEKETSG